MVWSAFGSLECCRARPLACGATGNPRGLALARARQGIRGLSARLKSLGKKSFSPPEPGPQALKRRHGFSDLAARVNSCPSTTPAPQQFCPRLPCSAGREFMVRCAGRRGCRVSMLTQGLRPGLFSTAPPRLHLAGQCNAIPGRCLRMGREKTSHYLVMAVTAQRARATDNAVS